MNIEDIKGNDNYCIEVKTKDQYNMLVPFMRGNDNFETQEFDSIRYVGDVKSVKGFIGMGYSSSSIHQWNKSQKTVIKFDDVVFPLESYRWETEYPHSDNEQTMQEYLQEHCMLDITLVDGTYAEGTNAQKEKFSIRASGDGDSFNHKIEFEKLETMEVLSSTDSEVKVKYQGKEIRFEKSSEISERHEYSASYVMLGYVGDELKYSGDAEFEYGSDDFIEFGEIEVLHPGEIENYKLNINK